jgi:hypothetical protein
MWQGGPSASETETRLADWPSAAAHTWALHPLESACMLVNVAAKALLGRAEQILYGRLVRAFPGHIVLSQVALSRLLTLDRPETGVADFVVCRADFTAMAVVELDHGQERCNDAQLHAAGVKVIRLPRDDIPHERALRALVATLPFKGRMAVN